MQCRTSSLIPSLRSSENHSFVDMLIRTRRVWKSSSGARVKSTSEVDVMRPQKDRGNALSAERKPEESEYSRTRIYTVRYGEEKPRLTWMMPIAMLEVESTP